MNATLEDGLYTYYKIKELLDRDGKPKVGPMDCSPEAVKKAQEQGGGCGGAVNFKGKDRPGIEFKPHGETYLDGIPEDDPEMIWKAFLLWVRKTNILTK